MFSKSVCIGLAIFFLTAMSVFAFDVQTEGGINPSVTNVRVECTRPDRCIDESTLTATWLATDNIGLGIWNATDWRINQQSDALINWGFDYNVSGNTSQTPDITSYNRRGNLTGITVSEWSSSCIIGGCYFYDNDSRIQYLDETFLLNKNNSFTISVWINSPGFRDNSKIVDAQPNNGGFSGFSLAFQTGVLGQLRFMLRKGDSSVNIDSANILNTNEWYHVVGVYNGSFGFLYVNSTLQTPKQVLALNTTEVNLTIGSRSSTSPSGNTSLYFRGYIDQFKYWNRVLSQDEINQIYQNGLQGKDYYAVPASATTPGEKYSVCITSYDYINSSLQTCSDQVTITTTVLSGLNMTIAYLIPVMMLLFGLFLAATLSQGDLKIGVMIFITMMVMTAIVWQLINSI